MADFSREHQRGQLSCHPCADGAILIFGHLRPPIFQLTDPQLRDSLRRIGPLLPVFYSGGSILDGRRRQSICALIGRSIRVAEIAGADAPRVLWLLHPDRALRRWGHGLELREQCELFGVSAAEVARARHGAARLNYTERRDAGIGPVVLHGALEESTRLQLRIPGQVKARLLKRALARKETLSNYVRRILMESR